MGDDEPPTIAGSVVETAPVPVVLYDADHRIRYANDAAVEFARAEDRSQLVGRSVLSFVADESEPAVRERLDRVVEDRERVPRRELVLEAVDGETVYAEAAGGPVTYEGEPAGQAVLHDVTDLRRREQELRRERDRLTALFDTVPEPVVLATLEDGVPVARRVNDAFEAVFGYDADEVVGENVNEFIIPEGREAEARELDRRSAALEEVQREVTRLTADGPREFLFRATPFEFGDRVESLAIYVDISEQKAREGALQRERDRFATLFENLPTPVVHGEMVDGEPVIKQVNPAFAETFGYDAEAVVGENLDELTVPDDRREQARALNERIAETGRYRTEVVRGTVDGPREFVLDVVMDDEASEPREGYAIYTDITEQKQREAELERQNERLEEFAGIVSHDLRNPLSVARGNLDLARDDGDPERLDRVAESLARMDDLLEELLALAREGEAVDETEPVDLRAAARRAWNDVATGEATLDAADAPTVEADPIRLEELLGNLFRNAVEHGSTSSRPAADDAVEHADDGVAVRVEPLDDGFCVVDDGPGVPPEEREAVFEPGHTTAADGTGFGLAIVDDIAAAHGWEVRLDEGPDGGACFEFSGVAVGEREG